MRFLARRLGFLLIALWAAMTVNFLIPRLMPGNPAEAMLGRVHGHITPTSLKALEVAFGINNHQSLISSYFEYLNNCVHLNFGISLGPNFPESVSKIIGEALPWSLGLVGRQHGPGIPDRDHARGGRGVATRRDASTVSCRRSSS